MELVLTSEEIDTSWRRRRMMRNQKSWKPNEISDMGEKCFIVFLAADERNVLWGSSAGMLSFIAWYVPTSRYTQIGEMDPMFHDTTL